MLDVIILAITYLLTMLLGYSLKHFNIMKKEDKKIISNLIFYITLPAMLISSYSDVTVNVWYFISFILGLSINLIMIITGIICSKNKSPELKAIYTLNASGFNLANIAIPFLRNFYPSGIPYLCMFDTGDSCFSLGTTYAIASLRMKNKTKNPVKAILKSLITSPPFDTYALMTILSIASIKLPKPVMSFAAFAGSGNGFLAMIMIGLSLEFNINKNKLKDVFYLLCMRYTIGILSAVIIFCFIPAPLIMRQVLTTAMFSAVPAVAIIYNERLAISTDISAAVNPISTMLMIPLMVIVLSLTM